MPIQVQTPDGNIAQFPDGMSDAQISAVLAKEFPPAKSPDAATKKGGSPNVAVDVARSLPGGVAKGAAAVIGLPGDLMRLARSGQNWVGNKVVEALGGKPIPEGYAPEPFMPGSEQVSRDLAAPFGGYYKPQTAAGRYAETIASFAPAALSPGSGAARVARVVIPGAASEGAGEAVQGTELEPYARVAGAVAGGLAAGPAIRTLNAGLSRIGAPLENPDIAARTMLADAIRRDGGQSVVRANLDAWRGNSAPALIDVTGNNVRRLVRSAASGGRGEAQNTATTYADRIAANLQDNAQAVASRLTPGETRGAAAYTNDLEAAQRDAADTQYRAPYAQPAQVTREMVSALQGPEGRRAIRSALSDASANRDAQQMAELQDLLSVAEQQGGGRDAITGRVKSIQQALEGVSAGSLDRVRIAMRETGRSLAAAGRNSRARGYGGRVRDIDTALDQTPGLRDARASYRDFARRQDAVETGLTGLKAKPEEYGAAIADLAGTPGAREAAGAGYRSAITEAIGAPTEGATGVLNRLANSNNQTLNLTATYGPEAARDFQTGIGNEISRVRNSRFISPNTGSQTELRLQDSGLLDIPTSKVGLIGHVWDKIKSSSQLTEQERNALVRMGTSEARLQELARANPSLTRTALTQALLGSNSGRK